MGNITYYFHFGNLPFILLAYFLILEEHGIGRIWNKFYFQSEIGEIGEIEQI